METVTVRRPALTTDDYNATVPDWDDTTDTDVAGCLFAPRGAAEVPETQQPRLTGTLYMPLGASVSELDRIVIRGDEWEVVGLPNEWRNHPGPSGLEVFVERTPTSEEGS